MSSLAKCVDLHNVDEIDGFRLTVAADGYKKRGFTEKEAAEKAVKIAIKELQAERAGIASQLPEAETEEVAANEKTQTKEPTESYVSDPTGGAVSSEKKDDIYFETTQAAKTKDKPLTTEAIEKAFGKMKNVTTGQDSQGNFWFRFNGFPKHTILEMDSINDRIGLTDKRIKTGAFVPGEEQIWFKTGGVGVKADIGSLHHENYHLFKRMGVVSKPDTRAIHRAIRKKGHTGQITEETEASFIGNAAKSREYARSTRIGRIIQKLRDFLDAMVNLIQATSGGVVRRMESGKIVGEKVGAEKIGKVSPAMAFEMAGEKAIGADKGALAKAQKMIADGEGTSFSVAKKEDPLSVEARKYKTAESFVKIVATLKNKLKQIEDTFLYPDKISSKQRVELGKKAALIRKKLYEKTGDYFGEITIPKAPAEPMGYNSEYEHPSELPIDVFNYAQSQPLLTTDANDAVRLSRIIGTKKDERYPAGNITIYRAVEKSGYNDIRPGDWVTTESKYAEAHNERYFEGKGRVIEAETEGKDVLVSPTGNNEEAIYAPLELSQGYKKYNPQTKKKDDYAQQLTDVWNKAQKQDSIQYETKYETKDVNLSEEIPEEDTAFQQAIDMVAAHWGKQGKYTDERKKLTFMEHHFGTTMYNAKRIGGWYNRFYNVIRNLGQYKFEQQHRLRSEGDASLFAPLETFKKKNKVEYRKLKNYLVDYDIYASGLKVRPTLDKAYEGAYDIVDEKGTVIDTLTTEDDAFNVAWELEADKTDFTDAGKEALLNFRKMARNLYKHYAAGMKEIIEMARLANQPVPKVTTIKAGKKIEIDLKQALQIMGDRQGHYFPRIRETGEWKIEGTKEGMPTQMELFTSKALSRGYAQKLRREGYKVELVHSGAFSEDLYQTLAPLLAQEQVINSVIDKVSKNEEFDAAYADAFIKQYAVMLKSHGSRARMIGRSDAIGVDVKRGYETDPVRAIAIATEAAAGGYSKQQVAINSMKAITGRDLTWSEYSKDNPDDKYNDYLKVIRKRGADAARQQTEYKEATETLRDILKNQELADRVIGTLKGMAVVWYLGGRVSSAAVNTTNMVMGVPATIVGELSDKSGKISFGSAFRSIGKAGIAYGSFRAGKSKNPGEAALFQEIEKRGWDSPQFNMEALNAIQSKYGAAWGTIVDKSMWMFGVTEKINRATSIAAGYMALCKKNKVELLGTDGAPHEKLLLKARNASDVAHGVYGKENRPYHMRGDHVGARVLQMAYVFQTFTHNYLQEMIRLGLVKKQYGAAAYMALSGGVIGGLGAAVPVGVAKAIASLFDADDPEEEMIKGAEETFGLGKLARYGLPGYLGVSLKGSLATRFEIPDTTLEWFGAPGNVVVDIWSGTKSLTKGFYREGFEQIAPVAIGNISRGLREKTEGVTTKSGSPVFFGKERIKGDSYDMMLRWLSFNPTGISEKREIQWNEYKTMDRYKGRKRDLYERYKRFYSKPPGERSMKDKVDILSDMRDFNIEIERKKISRIVRPITKRSIKQSMRSLTPSKRERER